MQIKLELSAKQLSDLHIAIEDPKNQYFGPSNNAGHHKTFVWIISVEGKGQELYPLPTYNVTLGVAENYEEENKKYKTPLKNLQLILQAIGLFPAERIVIPES